MSSSSVLFDLPGPRARARNRVLSLCSAVVFGVIVAAIVWKLNDKGQFEGAKWTSFTGAEMWESYLLPGLIGTLKAAALSIVLAAVFGLVFALLRMSHVRAVSWSAGAVVEFFRAVPVLLMMIFSWGIYVQYNVFASEYSTLAAVVTALTLYNGSVICEVIRAGVGQLPKGQSEAGLSIGLTQQQTLRSILLPQAITAMLPSLVSQLVVILKDTALGYNITYLELLYSGNTAGSSYSNLIPLLIVIAVIYIVINYSVTKFAEYLESRLKTRGRGTKGNTGLASVTEGPEMVANRKT